MAIGHGEARAAATWPPTTASSCLLAKGRWVRRSHRPYTRLGRPPQASGEYVGKGASSFAYIKAPVSPSLSLSAAVSFTPRPCLVVIRRGERGSGGENFGKEMARRRVELKRIENRASRHVTFSKRRNGLMKKAYEISVLCGVEVALIIFSSKGKLYEFSSAPSMTNTLERYQQHVNHAKDLIDSEEARRAEQEARNLSQPAQKEPLEPLDNFLSLGLPPSASP